MNTPANPPQSPKQNATAQLRAAIDLMIYSPDRRQGVVAAGAVCRLAEGLLASLPPGYAEPQHKTSVLALACTSGTWNAHWYRGIDDESIAMVHRCLDALHKVSIRVSGYDDLFDVGAFIRSAVHFLNPYTITWLMNKGYDLSPVAIGCDLVALLEERSGGGGGADGRPSSMFGEVGPAVQRFRSTNFGSGFDQS